MNSCANHDFHEGYLGIAANHFRPTTSSYSNRCNSRPKVPKVQIILLPIFKRHSEPFLRHLGLRKHCSLSQLLWCSAISCEGERKRVPQMLSCCVTLPLNSVLQSPRTLPNPTFLSLLPSQASGSSTISTALPSLTRPITLHLYPMSINC